MTRAEKIEFVKQQTELAKKIALRPHLAESDVLAAILELDNKVTLIRYHLFQILYLAAGAKGASESCNSSR
jgi:hypothetical protein